MSDILVRSFVEVGAEPIKTIWLPDHLYAEAIQCLVPACADVLVINRTNRLAYLAKRKSKPMAGWWLIGGRMIPGESPLEGAIRNFVREAYIIPSAHPELVAVLDYRFKDRAQIPQDIGCQMVGFTYTLELGPEELEGIQLDPQEYVEPKLYPFDRDRLVAENVPEPILWLYDHLFPPE